MSYEITSSDSLNDPAVRYIKAKEGISKSDFLAIVTMTGMNLSEFINLLPVSRRTIEKVQREDLLSPVVSDRVLQIAALYQHGVDTFQDPASFNAWLRSPVIALGNKKPFDFIDNDTGISLVNDLLGRITHGVYS
ncbi:MAG: antitoxin Xre/MbcA/ParS toxin-binding domain-containing protein [Bacteroidota bacterium]